MKNIFFKIQKRVIADLTRNLIIVALLSFSHSVFAQRASYLGPSNPVHEISLHGGGGLSSLRYQMSFPDGHADVSGGFGGDFGIGYTCFLIERWGIHSGAGLGIYNAKSAFVGVSAVTPNLADSDGDLFDMHSALAGYSETQSAMFLNIPVMVKFQSRKNPGLYVMGGVKAAIPLGGKYSARGSKLTNTGYYPNYENWATEQEFAGFGVFDIENPDKKLKFDASLLFATEGGIKLSIGNNFFLYVGAYFDYGLNNAVHDDNLPFIAYSANNGSDFSANSVMTSLAEKVNVMAVGVKVRVAFRR